MIKSISVEELKIWLKDYYVDTNLDEFLARILEYVVERILSHLGNIDTQKEITSRDITESIVNDPELSVTFRGFEGRKSRIIGETEANIRKFYFGGIMQKILPKCHLTEDGFYMLNLYIHDVLYRFGCVLEFDKSSILYIKPCVIRVLGEKFGSFVYREVAKTMIQPWQINE